MSDPVLLSFDNDVAVISFNRPEKHNAANDAMDARFFEILEELHARSDVRAIVLRGEGKSFSSGRDMTELGVRAQGESDLEFIARGHAYTKLILSMPAPIIAALKGWVIGGSFERALLCDIRIASDDAKMMLPETKHGVIPDSGGVARLFQMAGHGIASDMALTGRVMTASEALQHGVISRIVAIEDLDEEAMSIAREIAKRSPLAIKMARSIISSLGTPDVERTMHDEMIAQTVVFASDDYAEMKSARSENRDPKITVR
ncbi:MAG: enoyl-CoA hydratase/isomerase family protein [Actinomycetota bacterium]